MSIPVTIPFRLILKYRPEFDGLSSGKVLIPGQTYLNASGKTITALIRVEWFGKPTQMIGSLSGPKSAHPRLLNEQPIRFVARNRPCFWSKTVSHRVLVSFRYAPRRVECLEHGDRGGTHSLE
jgi:hypothetical protein